MIAGPEDPDGSAQSPRRSRDGAEKLGYISDIVLELKRLAEGAGYQTLGAILAAAHTEANVQREDMDG